MTLRLVTYDRAFKKDSDMRQGYLLNLICDIGIDKRHATLTFLEVDRGHGPRVKGPLL